MLDWVVGTFANPNITQCGLLLDIVGFVIIFVFGGFQFGVGAYVSDNYSWYVLPMRIIGSVLVLAGFVLQIYGAL